MGVWAGGGVDVEWAEAFVSVVYETDVGFIGAGGFAAAEGEGVGAGLDWEGEAEGDDALLSGGHGCDGGVLLAGGGGEDEIGEAVVQMDSDVGFGGVGVGDDEEGDGDRREDRGHQGVFALIVLQGGGGDFDAAVAVAGAGGGEDVVGEEGRTG